MRYNIDLSTENNVRDYLFGITELRKLDYLKGLNTKLIDVTEENEYEYCLAYRLIRGVAEGSGLTMDKAKEKILKILED